MSKTHYDTLKVTQDAPEEVISAAYKALARMYHPDRTGSKPEAMAVMQEINVSYNILIDKQKRAEHDLWISQQERRSNPLTSEKNRRSVSSGSEKQSRANAAMAEASKWKLWSEKTALEAKEAQQRADKAVADLAKAKPEDRAKWETWAAKTAQEAKEARERADKASAQAAKAVAEALEAAAQAKGEK
jgi:DnaJ-class molecular chaperone